VSEVMLACKIYFSDRLCVQVGWVGQSNSTTLVLFFQWTKYKNLKQIWKCSLMKN